MRFYFHNATCLLPLVCSGSQPDYDPVESKHVTYNELFYKVVFDGYLFIPYPSHYAFILSGSCNEQTKH